MSNEGESEDSAYSSKEMHHNDSVKSETEEDKMIDVLQKSPDKNVSLATRIKSDPIFKEKAVLTLCLYWTFVTLGWTSAQFGPAFLDLQIITKTNVKKASAFLTSRAVGILTGGILTGLLFDRINKLLIMAVFPFAGAIISAILPWCFLYELMIAAQFCGGCYCGGIGSSGNALLMYIWGQEGRSYMQALHFFFAIGGIISPLVTSPFLLKTQDDIYNSVITDTENISLNAMSDCSSNTSQYLNNTCMDSYILSNDVMVHGYDRSDSKLYVAYILTAAMNLSCAILIFVLYLRAKQQRKNSTQEIAQASQRISKRITFGFRFISLVLLSMFAAIYCAVEDTFTAYLTTFCVTQLKWSKVQGSYVMSVFWAVFGFARFLGIWIIKFISPAKIICGLTIGLCIDLGALLALTRFLIDEGVWICAVCTGAFLSLMYPCLILWTEEKLFPVTGRIVSLLMIASSSGAMTNPIILGYLMETFTPMWFTYLLLGESILLVILFLVLVALASTSKSRFGADNSNDNVPVDIRLTSKGPV